MKEYRVEILFIGVIILSFAIWKISEMIKMRCYQTREKIREGFNAAKKAETLTHPVAPSIETMAANILSQYGNSIQANKDTVPLSTEGFTVNTSEDEMTIHQRKKVATSLDKYTSMPTPTPTPTPTALSNTSTQTSRRSV